MASPWAPEFSSMPGLKGPEVEALYAQGRVRLLCE